MSTIAKKTAPALSNGSLKAMPKKVDNFFEQSLDDFFKLPKNTLIPAVNIKQSDKKYSLKIAAPGLKKKDFKVVINDGILTISAEKESRSEDSNKKYTRREYSYNAFSRSFALPNELQDKAVKARYKDGILTVNVPKNGVIKGNSPTKKVTVA
jgi:HSP20 family protein